MALKIQISALLSDIYWPLGILGYQLSKGQFLHCGRDGDAIQIHLPRVHHENYKFTSMERARDV